VLLWVSWAGFVLLLTPTGRLPSPRWRWWARLAVATPVLMVLGSVVQPDPLAPDYHGNPLAVPALARVLVVPGRGRRCDHPGLAAGGGRVAGVRFRRARGVERQQLRWLAYAAALAAGLLLVALVAAFLLVNENLVLMSLTLCVALLPLATGAAILRYRLYDIDRIVSRTVAYGLLTVLLGGGYAGVVLGLGRLLPQDSSLVVAGATLAVAAVFQPARRRIQALVDRRFNRPWGARSRCVMVRSRTRGSAHQGRRGHVAGPRSAHSLPHRAPTAAALRRPGCGAGGAGCKARQRSAGHR
jgi:hypothetical protein